MQTYQSFCTALCQEWCFPRQKQTGKKSLIFVKSWGLAERNENSSQSQLHHHQEKTKYTFGTKKNNACSEPRAALPPGGFPWGISLPCLFGYFHPTVMGRWAQGPKQRHTRENGSAQSRVRYQHGRQKFHQDEIPTQTGDETRTNFAPRFQNRLGGKRVVTKGGVNLESERMRGRGTLFQIKREKGCTSKPNGADLPGESLKIVFTPQIWKLLPHSSARGPFALFGERDPPVARRPPRF